MKINNIFTAKHFIKYVALTDNNNIIKETYENITNKKAFSLYDVISNNDFLKKVIEIESENENELTNDNIKEFTLKDIYNYYL